VIKLPSFAHTVTMVAFSSLVVALSVIAASVASPVDITEIGLADFVLRRDNSSLARRQTPNYNQDYTTGGTVNYSPSGGSFSVNWNTQNDFVVGVGWTTGSTT
jgi:endo-1,4-beta-xylanase